MYGESAIEARFIALEIDLFGRDLIDALHIVSSTTPSYRMKEFLQGAMGCISSGSNLTEYFRTKAEQYSLENRQNQKMFLDTLGLIAESYVTAMVAGPLFLIILQSIMSILSRQTSAYIPVHHHLPHHPTREYRICDSHQCNDTGVLTMALKDIFSGKSRNSRHGNSGARDRRMLLSPPGKKQRNTGGLAGLYEKEKPPQVEILAS